jgi:hypothetical protein
VVEVELTLGPRLSASTPRVLWNARDLKLISAFVSALPDDRMVAIRRGESEDDITRLDVVLGFPRLLEERLRRVSAK